MRLHHLTMTAFGPYAGTETVAFDELNDAGVFLLTGPTGAGKTSILDAVCFALYGVVPGVREVKTLRSHHAPEGVAPEVVLEATIGTRRYRIRRSPEWHRPKKRGDGVTRENACAALTVIENDGTERLVSSRIAEVGHELTMALGMSSEQFMQVVLLPQGDFQKFLRATSDERQDVLQKLFRTHRFARIEDWMRHRARELGDRASRAEKQVSQLLATIANRAATVLPDELQGDTLGDVSGIATDWARATLASARAELESAGRAERTAHATLEQARSGEQRAHEAAAAAEKQSKARAVLDSLEESAAEAADDLTLLHRHEAALTVRPLLQPLAQLHRDADAADTARDRALEAVASLPAGLSPVSVDRDGCTSLVRTLSDRLAELRAVLPREAALHRAGAEMQAALGARDDLRTELETLTERADRLPAEREEAVRRLAENQLVVRALEDARAALEQAAARHEASTALPGARAAHDALVREGLDARERAATARERHLDVVERRLAGMAAELAGQLEEDQPCAVCGSHEHPAPAQRGVDAVTSEDQRTAAEEAERVRAVAERLAGEIADSAGSLQALEAAASGLSAAEALTELTSCQDAVAAAEAAVAAAPALEARAAALDREHDDVSSRLIELREQAAARDAEVAALKAAFEEAAGDVARAVGPGAGPVAGVIAQLERAVEVAKSAAAALQAHEAIQDRLTTALAQADAEAAQQGFASSDEAARAVLDPPLVEALEARLQERDELRRGAMATLAEADVLPGDEELPDLASLRAAVASATDEWRRAGAALGSVEQCATALASLVDQLDAALAEWEPARAEHAVAEAMTRLVRGVGSDNQLQMRLSSYVLATRLDQVLEAANERLAQMRDQRYSLRRCGKTRGNARAGLGLEVLDTWTGEARAPSTLSGGETFVVSLALALGLADVVTQESGGTRVDTLFIDEGFGMLDPDTLDDVMDRIDALRAGGRTVGVVSHVTELRSRIPNQLHVERGRDGSSVAVRNLVA